MGGSLNLLNELVIEFIAVSSCCHYSSLFFTLNRLIYFAAAVNPLHEINLEVTRIYLITITNAKQFYNFTPAEFLRTENDLLKSA